MTNFTTAFFKEHAAKGGRATTEAKVAAARLNIRKASEALASKRAKAAKRRGNCKNRAEK